MFNRKPKEPDYYLVALDQAIEDTHKSLRTLSAGDEDHATATDQLVKLHAMRTEHLNRRKPFSWDTLAIVAGNAVVAVIIVGYERANVVTTKVPQFQLKASKDNN